MLTYQLNYQKIIIIRQFKVMLEIRCNQSNLPMIKFLDILQNKYQVLSRLTEKQSEKFTEEIISLLVDEDKNVDLKAYKEIKNSIGIEAFILQILGNVIDRNPFKNQSTLQTNISEIQSNIQQKMEMIAKKTRILSRKQNQLNGIQKNMKNKIREYLVQCEKEVIKKLGEKENQMKKNINDSINVLRNKERLIIQKKKIIEQKVQQLKQRQKKIQLLNERSKLGNNELKNYQNIKYTKQAETIKAINMKCQNYQQQIQKLKKRNHNNQLAYKRMKVLYENQKVLHQQYKQKIQINQSNKCVKKVDKPAKNNQIKCFNQQNKDIMGLLDKLELSAITETHHYSDYCCDRSESDNIKMQKEQPRKKKNEQQQQALLPQFLKQNTMKQKDNNLLQTISTKYEEDPEQLIQSGLLEKFCETEIYYWNVNQIISFFDLLFQLVQNHQNHYYKAIQHLSRPIFISFLQKCYLNNETNEEIAEATTLILSRICMSVEAGVQFSSQFSQAVALRKKMINEEAISMLDQNILYLSKLMFN